MLALASIGLALRNRAINAQLRRELARGQELSELLELERPPPLGAGDRFPQVTMLDSRGDLAAPFRAGRGALLFVWSTACGACEDMRPVWDRAAIAGEAAGIEVAELVIGATPETLIDRSAFPALAPGGDEWRLTSRMLGVPASYVIGEDGVIVAAFYGADQPGLVALVEDAVESAALRVEP